MFKSSLLAAAILAAVTAPTHAEIAHFDLFSANLPVTGSFPSNDGDVDASASLAPTVITLPTFTLGTVQALSLEVMFGSRWSVSVSRTGCGVIGSGIDCNAPRGGGAMAVSVDSTSFFSSSPYTTTCTSPGCSRTFSPIFGFGMEDKIIALPLNATSVTLAATGTFRLEDPTVPFIAGATTSTEFSMTGFVQVLAHYTYAPSPVPLPLPVLMFAAAVAGFGAWRWAWRARA